MTHFLTQNSKRAGGNDGRKTARVYIPFCTTPPEGPESAVCGR